MIRCMTDIWWFSLQVREGFEATIRIASSVLNEILLKFSGERPDLRGF